MLYTTPLHVHTNLQCTITPLQARLKYFQVTVFLYNGKETPKYLFVDDNLLEKVRYFSDNSQSTQKPVQGKTPENLIHQILQYQEQY